MTGIEDFWSMVNIGKIIRDLIHKSDFTVKQVAEQMNMSESNLFDIYNRKEIEIHKIEKFSKVLDKNLFLNYISKEEMKSVFSEDFINYENRIKELEAENSLQQSTINMLTDTVNAYKKSDTSEQQPKK